MAHGLDVASVLAPGLHVTQEREVSTREAVLEDRDQ
jgi:hypothetical protein